MLAHRAAVAAAAALLAASVAAFASTAASPASGHVRVLRIDYVAHDGQSRVAYVLLPHWYGPARHPAIPLVISPHGRGADPAANVGIWGDLPDSGSFAVVNPEGQGRRLPLDSWGYPGQIADLARMPAILRKALPWLRIDPRRVYAVGDSMGGQESLLLAAQHPRLLAGVVAFDATADLALRYTALARLARAAQAQLVDEVGGTPTTVPAAYAVRSPLHYVRQLAFSRLPIQLWWSRHDALIHRPGLQSEKLFHRILALDPRADVVEYVGVWQHGTEMRRRLPEALHALGVLRPRTAAPRGHTVAVAP